MRRVITYGERVRELREEKASTQEQLTDVAGLQSVRSVQSVERMRPRALKRCEQLRLPLMWM
jgi:transcriptional regulator with XRE-family HTH domain